MAHGDYNCCAICDRKMEYSYDAETKATLCPRCAVDFFVATGARAMTSDDLVAWISANPDTARVTLDALGFSRCFYPNAVDEAYARAPHTPGGTE